MHICLIDVSLQILNDVFSGMPFSG